MPGRDPRVLHIDDDDALARLIQRVLGRAGYQVENAATGEAGLARIREGGIDAVVLDHYLGGETGLRILQCLAGIPDAPPVVYVTGSTEPMVAVEALKAGAADYVLKTAGEDFPLLLESAIALAMKKAGLQREKDRAEREVREARDRAELLLAEVNHRVSNSLALVAALVRMQISAVSDQTARDALAETQARLSAIADLHRRLYTSDDIGHVDLNAYLGTVVGTLEASMKAAGHLPRVRHALAPFRIATDKAVSVGMIVTELVTNACKYAYPGGETGEVRVLLQVKDGVQAVLTVEDDGVGLPEGDAPKGTGLGTRIVQAMATSLGTSINYGSEGRGTRAWIVIDISDADPA